MDYAAISDIHGYYTGFHPDSLPDASVLLIGGDITNVGTKDPAEVNAAIAWFKLLRSKYENIFYVFGNHDLYLTSRDFDSDGVTCVQDKVVKHNGLRIAGANLTVCYNRPRLKNFWTNMTDNPSLEAGYYDSLPKCDILISHSPPAGRLGLTTGFEQCGSEKLKEYIERSQPKLVVCGHIHEAAGSQYVGETLVLNCAERNYYLGEIKSCSTKKKKSQ